VEPGILACKSVIIYQRNTEHGWTYPCLLQFKFSGDVEDSCYFIIEKGNLNTKTGAWENPELTVETPFNVWMDTMTRKADGRQMLIEQKYKVHGDLSLMMQKGQQKESSSHSES